MPRKPFASSADLGVKEQTLEENGQLISSPPFDLMYWTPAQQLAHMTVNGATLRPGDLFASGTVSGSAEDQRGSLIELSWGGTQPLHRSDGSTRTFLEDGDTVTITATAPGPHGTSIAFGEVTGRVVPARRSSVTSNRPQTVDSCNGGGPRLCRTRQ